MVRIKTEKFHPQNIEDILKGYQKISEQKLKAKEKFHYHPTTENKKLYQQSEDEWVKFREEYKAVLQASIVKSDE